MVELRLFPISKTYSDGWRTLRLFLLYSPRWLFLAPGALLLTLGLLGYLVALPGMTFFGVSFDAHTLLFATLAILCGYQAIVFAVFTKTFAMGEGILPEDPRLYRLFAIINLERGIGFSVLMMGAGVFALGVAVLRWKATGFGPLDYAATMRWVIPGAMLTALGWQTLLASFFVSILGMRRK